MTLAGPPRELQACPVLFKRGYRIGRNMLFAIQCAAEIGRAHVECLRTTAKTTWVDELVPLAETFHLTGFHDSDNRNCKKELISFTWNFAP